MITIIQVSVSMVKEIGLIHQQRLINVPQFWLCLRLYSTPFVTLLIDCVDTEFWWTFMCKPYINIYHINDLSPSECRLICEFLMILDLTVMRPNWHPFSKEANERSIVETIVFI